MDGQDRLADVGRLSASLHLCSRSPSLSPSSDSAVETVRKQRRQIAIERAIRIETMGKIHFWFSWRARSAMKVLCTRTILTSPGKDSQYTKNETLEKAATPSP